MSESKTISYAIKYRVHKLSDNEFVLIPEELEEGLSDGVSFCTNDVNIPILRNKNSLTHRYVAYNIKYTEDLEKIYDYDENTDFLGQVFYGDNENSVLYCKTSDDGDLKIYDVNFDRYKNNGPRHAIYQYDKNGEPMVTLNREAIDYIISGKDKDEIKRRLEFYKKEISKFSENEKDGVVRIDTINDKITLMDERLGKKEMDSLINEVQKNVNINLNNNIAIGNPNVSFIGLRDAIKKNVFGHDKEINIIAKRLYRNHIAGPNRKIKSVLIIGPTGTGKTETVKSAARYLGVPYVRVNTSDLVPTGIVGPKIGDYLLELYLQSGKKKEIAEKSLFFLDEYEKLGNLDVKSQVKASLLTFNEGEKIMVSNLTSNMIFDTSRLNRVYGGVFEKVEELYRKIGYESGDVEEKKQQLTGPEIKKAIIKAKYFSAEDMGRIRTFVRFGHLDKETRVDILKNAGGSDLLDTILGFKQDFGVDIEVNDDFIYSFLETVPENEGIRDMGAYLDIVFDKVEDILCEVPKSTYKKLVLTKDTVDNNSNFKLY
jgi:ATP-dependent protease Clp ATPase subunit